MYGTLSQNSSGRGIAFYRLMALAGVISSVVFAFVFLVLFRSSHEMIWDRVACFVFALFLYIWGFSSTVSTGKYARLLLVFFYVHSTQVLWSVLLNDFDVFYFLSLFITVQAYVYALRSEKETFWYLSYICAITIAGVFIVSKLSTHDRVLYTVIVIMASGLQYLASRVKCRFMRDMRMNQDLLKSLIIKTETAIFLTDINGNIFDVNPRALELFGYEKHELIDRDFKILRKKNLTDAEIEEGLSELEKNRFWNTQTKLVKKCGEEFHVRTSITLVKNGIKKYMVYRVQDITLMKDNEARIIEARDNAEVAASAKSQFLAVMSHEIRTPLNGVIATASLLEQTTLDREQEEYATTIRKSGQSLLMLINDILEFSKMESGKMVLDPFSCETGEIMFDVLDLLRPHAESKNIQLEATVDPSIPRYLMLDGHRLKQVLVNLTGNAIKFTDKGSVSISCMIAETLHDQVRLCFRVKDTGIGIPADKMHLLFQSFSQVDSSTSRRYGGTGLGLAISRQLIELMGGQIHVTSEDGIGTEFTFYISANRAADQKTLEKVRSGTSSVDFSDLKVLVAEDNEINKQVFRFMLDSLSLKPDIAEDGRQVLEACNQTNYDIIFMDMQMPEMDGIEATIYIRSNFDHQPVIVATSANSYPEDRQRCSDAGMNDFLCKPFDIDQLRDVMARWKNSGGEQMHPAA